MICAYCNGPVEWKGLFSNLTHTECLGCGRHNCQVAESEEGEEDDA